jgi:hypothetical protein
LYFKLTHLQVPEIEFVIDVVNYITENVTFCAAGVPNALTTTIKLRPLIRPQSSNQISENCTRHLTTKITMSYNVIDWIKWAFLSLSKPRNESM